MNINHKIVLEIEERTKCPILEMFWTKDDNKWYVCFQEDIEINGVDQIVHLDDVMAEVKEFDNIENFTNEVGLDYDEDEIWFEQVTFEWEE